MITNGTAGVLFVLFVFLTQGLLIVNFAARNWRPRLETKHGWVVYAMGIPGAILGVLFLVWSQPWYIVAAPFVYAVWGALGYYVDRWKEIQWHSPPRWSVFIPYVALFMASQFFFWIPLWYVGLGYWIAYTVTYVINTGLNIYSHRRPASQPGGERVGRRQAARSFPKSRHIQVAVPGGGWSEAST